MTPKDKEDLLAFASAAIALLIGIAIVLDVISATAYLFYYHQPACAIANLITSVLLLGFIVDRFKKVK